MGFQENRSAISICNKALARIHQQPLAGSLTDPANNAKLAGRECNRWYKTVVRTLLEQHHFGLATKRVGLIDGGSNRADWNYAYLAPTDMAFPVSLDVFSGSGTQLNYYVGIGYLMGLLGGQPVFRYEGNTIYSRVPGAQLEYVSYDITEADFTQSFENLVVGFLASELALPIAKDRALSNDLKQEALNEMNRIIAQSLNQTPQRYDTGPSEAEMARAGWSPASAGLWDFR